MAAKSMGEVKSHAGLEDGNLNLVVFSNKVQLKRMLDIIGLKVQSDETIVGSDGSVKHCSSCNHTVTLESVGHVMPGTYHIYCKDPACILDYLEQFV